MTLGNQLATLQNQIISYYLPFVYAFGMIGNAITIFVFSSRQLRTNICAWYFISLSFSQLLLLNSACLARIVTVTSGYDVSRYVLGLCKFRAYLYILSLVLSRHFICLISFDRWLITSPKVWLRRLSSRRIARLIISCSLGFWSIFSIHALIGYAGQTTGCVPLNNSFYELFYSMYSIVIGILPMIIISVFSILTITNVRKSIVRQIQPVVEPNAIVPLATCNNEQTRLRRNRDKQLIRLALIQVPSYIALNITTSIYPLYAYLTRSQNVINADQQAITSFLSTTGLIVLYTHSAMIFFVYIIASTAFRQECITVCKQYWINLQRHLRALPQ